MVRVLGFLLLVAVAGASAGNTACVKPTPTERAMSLARQHRDAEGIATLRTSLSEHPEDVEARKLLVRLLAFAGDLPAAQAEATELQRRMPAGDPTPWIEIGHAQELAHRFEEALAAYDTAASIAPATPLGPREGGMRAARWGEVEEARPRLEEAIRRGANDGAIWHALGLVRLHLGDLDAARDAYARGAAVDAASGARGGAENLLGLATVAVMRGDAAGALAAYDALLAKRPRFGAAELGRAWALARLGRVTDARRALDHAEELGAAPASVAKQRRALDAPPSP